MEAYPDATPILKIEPRQLKRDVLPLLEAGLEAARKVGVLKLRELWKTTRKAEAWDVSKQREAQEMHARGTLFVGTRKEDTPNGQEGVPDDIEADEYALPAGAPEAPAKYKPKSPRELFILSVRDGIKATRALKKMGDAVKIADEQWKGLAANDKKAWEAEKNLRLDNHNKAVKAWKAKIAELRAAAAAIAKGDNKDGEEEEDGEGEDGEDKDGEDEDEDEEKDEDEDEDEDKDGEDEDEDEDKDGEDEDEEDKDGEDEDEEDDDTDDDFPYPPPAKRGRK
jgi:hypothetical protein